MNLLIDECLSQELVGVAQGRGHNSTHVVWRGKSGAKDWELVELALEEDWTLVTKNSVDFRGPAKAPGSKGLYTKAGVHPGLICLNGPPGMDVEMQIELFERALDELDRDDDLINRVLEITLETEEDDYLITR
jgi:hypothetical protein